MRAGVIARARLGGNIAAATAPQDLAIAKAGGFAPSTPWVVGGPLAQLGRGISSG